MRLLAIDPGTTESAALILDTETRGVCDAAICDNADIRAFIAAGDGDVLAIEMVACYGMPVGKETFETVLWIGRFIEVWEWSRDKRTNESSHCALKVYRKTDVAMTLCHTMRAKDPHIRQAIIDLYGGKNVAIGTKKCPGLLYGIKSHLWSALAVALTAERMLKGEKE